MASKARKPRKDQKIVDLADRIRKELGDNRPKSFGLYVKMIKEFGVRRVNYAFWKAVRSNAKDKVRYFLGILSHLRKQKEILRAYRALRAPLLEKMTPHTTWRDTKIRKGTKVRKNTKVRNI
jgi:5-formyltetrahydrofolate cyclo-ligase